MQIGVRQAGNTAHQDGGSQQLIVPCGGVGNLTRRHADKVAGGRLGIQNGMLGMMAFKCPDRIVLRKVDDDRGQHTAQRLRHNVAWHFLPRLRDRDMLFQSGAIRVRTMQHLRICKTRPSQSSRPG